MGSGGRRIRELDIAWLRPHIHQIPYERAFLEPESVLLTGLVVLGVFQALHSALLARHSVTSELCVAEHAVETSDVPAGTVLHHLVPALDDPLAPVARDGAVAAHVVSHARAVVAAFEGQRSPALVAARRPLRSVLARWRSPGNLTTRGRGVPVHRRLDRGKKGVVHSSEHVWRTRKFTKNFNL